MTSGPAANSLPSSGESVKLTIPGASQDRPSTITVFDVPSNSTCAGRPDTGMLAVIPTRQAAGMAGLPHLSSALMPRKNASPGRRRVAVTAFQTAGGPGMIGT